MTLIRVSKRDKERLIHIRRIIAAKEGIPLAALSDQQIVRMLLDIWEEVEHQAQRLASEERETQP